MRSDTFSRPFRLALVSFTLAGLLASAMVLTRPLLYDSDGYYHVAVGEVYARDGIKSNLGLRASLLGENLGDKEFLFHLAKVPAIAMGVDPLVAGKLLIVFTLALNAGLVTWLAAPVIGRWAVVLPLWLPFAATQAAGRVLRLRPEILALALFLLALWALGRSRFRLLAAIAFVFTLSYTAFHALLGLCGLVFLQRAILRRRIEPAMVVYPILGAAVALLIHPHAPHNLVVWVRQSFDFFGAKNQLDVGTEIFPLTTDVLLRANVVLFGSLWTLWLARRPSDHQSSESDRDLTDTLGVGALVFGVLYLLMARFSIYFVPIFTLFVLWSIYSRHEQIGSHLSFGKLKLPTSVALVMIALVGVFDARTQLLNYLRRTDAGPNLEVLVDHEALSQALPEGAKVAATWQDTPVYLHWAPQGRYLNVLDPVFQAVPYPNVHYAQAALFAGSLPDPVISTRFDLDSDYIAYSFGPDRLDLTARLEADPRVQLRHRQYHLVWQMLPNRNQDFFLDWKKPLLSPGSQIDLEPAFSHPDELRPFLGYVDLWRASPPDVEGASTPATTPCSDVLHRVTEPFEGQLAFAPWGPSYLKLDGRTLIATEAPRFARLDQAIFTETTLNPGQRLEVRTCEAVEPEKRTPGRGFYLMRLPT